MFEILAKAVQKPKTKPNTDQVSFIFLLLLLFFMFLLLSWLMSVSLWLLSSLLDHHCPFIIYSKNAKTTSIEINDQNKCETKIFQKIINSHYIIAEYFDM